MSTLAAVGASPLRPSSSRQSEALAVPSAATAVAPPAAAQDAVHLSAEALAAHANALGHNTLDAAREFVTRIAAQLFGAGADAPHVSFDSVSLSVSAQASVATAVSDDGSAASLSVGDSAHFIGKGQIVTADGERYDFELEISYAAQTESSVAESAPSAPDAAALTGRRLPAISFPGSLSDLFELLGRDLQASVSTKSQDHGGNLTLRLLRLVNTAALIAPRASADGASKAAGYQQPATA